MVLGAAKRGGDMERSEKRRPGRSCTPAPDGRNRSRTCVGKHRSLCPRLTFAARDWNEKASIP